MEVVIILDRDGGSFGRETGAYIALESSQVKSADGTTFDDQMNPIPMERRGDLGNPDIRYSVVKVNGLDFNADPITQDRALRRTQRVETEVGKFAGKVQATKDDYRNVELKPGDVVYADIPYANTRTTQYGRAGKFDYNAFNAWAQKQTVPVYVSSYEAPGEGWTEVWGKDMQGVTGMKTERLYVQDKFAAEQRSGMRMSSQGRTGTEEDGAIFEMNQGSTHELDPKLGSLTAQNVGLGVVETPQETRYSLARLQHNVNSDKNRFDSLIKNWGNHGFDINHAFIGIARAIGIKGPLKKYPNGNFKSLYRKYALQNGMEFELRLGDHRGMVYNFRKWGSKNINSSVVIKFNDTTQDELQGVLAKGVPVEEFTYDKRAFKTKDDVLPLIRGIRNMLDTGTYVDLTGKAKYRKSGDIDAAHRRMAGTGQADVAIYIRNTNAHFVDNIFSGIKTVETRTLGAWAQIEKVLQAYGMQYEPDGETLKNPIRVAIISDQKVQGYVTILGVHHYADAVEFERDSRHAIPATSPFIRFDSKNPKVGLILANPQRIGAYSIPAASRPMGVRDAVSVGRTRFSMAEPSGRQKSAGVNYPDASADIRNMGDVRFSFATGTIPT